MVALALGVLLLAPGCGRGGGASIPGAVARAVATAAAAVVGEAIAQRRRRRRPPPGTDTAPWEPEPIATEPFEASEAASWRQSRIREPMPIDRALALGPEELTCERTADCVIVAADCCAGCEGGGAVVAVVAGAAERVRARVDARCGGEASCTPSLDPSCAGDLLCLHGLCRILPPEGASAGGEEPVEDAVPPPPEEGGGDDRGDLAVPSGYE